MYATPEQLQAAGKASLEDFFALAGAQLRALEKLANLNASAWRSALDESIAHGRAFLQAKEVQELLGLQGFQEMLGEMGTELSKAAQRRLAEWNNVLTQAAEARADLPKTKKAAG